MARSLNDLYVALKAVTDVENVYIQPPTDGMKYPCIMVERGGLSDVRYADNTKYQILKRYDITVIDRAPDSGIPDLVEGLPYAEFNRFFVTNELNHFVFQLYF